MVYSESSRFIMSIEIPDEETSSNTGYVGVLSPLSADDQDDELDEILSEPRTHSSSSNRSHRNPSKNLYASRNAGQNNFYDENRDSLEVGNRLYLDATEKEKQRARELRQKVVEETNAGPRRLNLATKRSYTPMKSRPSMKTVHDHLYSLSKKKIVEERIRKEEMDTLEKNLEKVVISPFESERVSNRLYERSRNQQEEGKVMREQIEKKLAPRAQTPSKKIPLSKATGMYDRGLAQKAQKQKKIENILNCPRESTFPKMRTQSTSRSSSRLRSQTPSRRDSHRSSTPSRSHRSSTPTRRPGAESHHSSSNYYQQKITTRPPAVKTREQSPDMR
mmetsp:Transcript_1992/g.2707  ORF Transcript_1992/g.2707 Transcript_1992/m.2707 type:complete len:334 (+) Transcript_1992:106-1107(+)